MIKSLPHIQVHIITPKQRTHFHKHRGREKEKQKNTMFSSPVYETKQLKEEKKTCIIKTTCDTFFSTLGHCTGDAN